jgi:hypothetical protein
MALCTIHDIMSFGQGEKFMIDILGSPVKSIYAVTFNTVRGKICGGMVRVRCGGIFIHMTIDAIIADPVEPEIGVRYMAVITARGVMGTKKGEPIVKMQLRDIGHQPVFGGMAPGAIHAHSLVVHVCMARYAFSPRF